MRVVCDNKQKARSFKWECLHPDRVMLNRARQRAKKKGIIFELTIDDIKIPDVCPILGIPLKINKGGRSGFFDDSPSLDRIKPELGYVKGNVRVLSARANLLRNNATKEEIEKILKDFELCASVQT